MAHTGHMESTKLALGCRRVGRYPTSLWMLYGIVSGHPQCVRRGIRVKDGTRVS
jgi:hypothetical protein